MRAYRANMLHLRTSHGSRVIVLSKAALRAYIPHQPRHLKRYGELLDVETPVIEGIAGGSARCMLAEVFRA